ncbi:hypothetical protein [uncultured Draconibacterium sp.]|uniref:hypothetical protein n=1 Tax=uncultured Draconibacterium sp. TaxID=1573823 RepID=UPI0025FF9BFD|nr:hypothetical protein [uncultured Draconibacterium sp.]
MKSGIIKLEHIQEAQRLSPKYHLSEGEVYLRKIASHQHETLDFLTESISNIGVNKRIFVLKKDFGIPFISNTTIGNINPLESIKYLSKKYHGNSQRLVEDGMILMAGIGSTSVGDVNYANSLIQGSLTPIGNVIRIKTNKKILSGYLYAFLKSKIGYSIIRRLVSGSGQTYLDPTTVSKIIIPLLHEDIYEQAHHLIVEVARLRVKAVNLLSEAVANFEKFNIDYSYGDHLIKNISLNDIKNKNFRFDALHGIVNEKIENSIFNSNAEFKTIKSQSVKIFIGPRTKRNYLDKGVPFLSTTAMQKANPTNVEKHISKKIASDFQVKKGYILTTRSGTLGDTIIALPSIDNYAVSEDAIRILLKQDAEISSEYLFAFLKSDIGKNSLLSGAYGSVIQHINEEYVGEIKVPILPSETYNKIVTNIKAHIQLLDKAINLENEAINLIETEIDSWQN